MSGYNSLVMIFLFSLPFVTIFSLFCVLSVLFNKNISSKRNYQINLICVGCLVKLKKINNYYHFHWIDRIIIYFYNSSICYMLNIYASNIEYYELRTIETNHKRRSRIHVLLWMWITSWSVCSWHFRDRPLTWWLTFEHTIATNDYWTLFTCHSSHSSLIIKNKRLCTRTYSESKQIVNAWFRKAEKVRIIFVSLCLLPVCIA